MDISCIYIYQCVYMQYIIGTCSFYHGDMMLYSIISRLIACHFIKDLESPGV